MWYAIVAGVCIFAGGAGGYLLGNKAIAEYEKAANLIGFTFKKIDGVVSAVRKAL